MRPSIPLLLLVVAAAGCSSPPSAPAEVLIESAPPEEVRSGNDSLPAAFEPSPKSRGHLAGVVVDQAIRPIEGARVRLPGLDLERTTDRDGSFGFVDLHPGPYFVTAEAAGYYAAEAVLTVEAEQFTRARVVLEAVPPPDPYRVQQQFAGYTELALHPFIGSPMCTECEFDFYVDRPGLQALVVEAVGDPMVEGDGFYHRFTPYGGTWDDTISTGTNDGPLRIEVRDHDLPEGDRFSLFVDPNSAPAPQAQKRFQVFVTAFYNEGPPAGWSFVAGDA